MILSIVRWSPLTYVENIYIFLEAVCLHLTPFFTIVYITTAVLLSGSYIYISSWMLIIRRVPFPILERLRVSVPLPTRSLLQKGRDHSPPKALLEESNTCFNLEYLGTWSRFIRMRVFHGVKMADLSYSRTNRKCSSFATKHFQRKLLSTFIRRWEG